MRISLQEVDATKVFTSCPKCGDNIFACTTLSETVDYDDTFDEMNFGEDTSYGEVYRVECSGACGWFIGSEDPAPIGSDFQKAMTEAHMREAMAS